MEKTIETIWKEGFLKSDALVAPKLNHLYTKKSKHIIDKFNRMFKINIIAIVAGSFLFLGFSLISGFPLMGISFFVILNIIAVVNKRLMKTLAQIDKNISSYQYLKSFSGWMKEQLAVNRRMARFYYPAIFLTMVLGFWSSSEGQNLYNEIIGNYNEIYMINGMPVFWLLGITLLASLLALFGGRIYNWDVGMIYGRVFKKLDEILADIEELRA